MRYSLELALLKVGEYANLYKKNKGLVLEMSTRSIGAIFYNDVQISRLYTANSASFESL